MRWTSAACLAIASDDGRVIPADPANADYAELLGSGAAIDPFVPIFTANDVRAECARRMCALVGARNAAHLEIVISNANREAIRLLRKGSANWTSEEATRAAQLEAADAAIEALRAVSNTLEGLSPIPTDYADNSRWPS